MKLVDQRQVEAAGRELRLDLNPVYRLLLGFFLRT